MPTSARRVPGELMNVSGATATSTKNIIYPLAKPEKVPICRCWLSARFPLCDNSHEHLQRQGVIVGPCLFEMKFERLKEMSQTASLSAIAASLVQPFVAIAGSDSIIRVFDISDIPKPVATLQGHQKCVNALNWNCSSLLASGSADGTVRVWRIGGLVHILRGHSLDVTDICWASETLLASSALDGNIFLWDTLLGDKIKTVETLRTGLKGLSVSLHSTFALTSDGQLSITINTKTSMRNLRNEDPRNFKDTPRDVAYSRRPSLDLDNGDLAIPFGQRDKRHAAVILSSDGTTLRSLRGHRARVTCVSYSQWLYDFATGSQSSLLALASHDGNVSVWRDSSVPLLVACGLVDRDAVITDIAWKEKNMFICSSDGSVTCVSLADLPGAAHIRGAYEKHISTKSQLAADTVGLLGKRRVTPEIVGQAQKKSRADVPAHLTALHWKISNLAGDKCSVTNETYKEDLDCLCYKLIATQDLAAACFVNHSSGVPFYTVRTWLKEVHKEWLTQKISHATILEQKYLTLLNGSKLEMYEAPDFVKIFSEEFMSGLEISELRIDNGCLYVMTSTAVQFCWDGNTRAFLITRA